jgi:hypothetical protein
LTLYLDAGLLRASVHTVIPGKPRHNYRYVCAELMRMTLI